MKRDVSVRLGLAICSLVVSALAGELTVRKLGAFDADGNFTIYYRTLKPRRLPVAVTHERVKHYLVVADRARTIYDALLGWSPGPNYTDDLYTYNAQGVRVSPIAPLDYSAIPPEGVLRIVILGDSYTHGHEVPFENTWGHYLEERLGEAGLPAEIINLGVGGYGMDQAFLRWQSLGVQFSPDLVIFGLQMENAARNVNLLRPLYHPDTSLPFSKPRFILNGDRLELINSPALPPEQVAETLANIGAWELAGHEYFLRPEFLENRLWMRSKLAALAVELASPIEADPALYDLSQEPAQVSLQIIREFRRDVEARGGKFLIVHLPIVIDLAALMAGRQPAYAELLAQIKEESPVVTADEALLKEAKAASLWSLYMKGGHYSATGNQVVAETLARFIVENHDEFSAIKPR